MRGDGLNSGLASIVKRLFQTPANSVPAKRGFSTLQLTHTKLRNRLAGDRVDQLCYIHINERVLESRGRKIYAMSEEELLQIEAMYSTLSAKKN